MNTQGIPSRVLSHPIFRRFGFRALGILCMGAGMAVAVGAVESVVSSEPVPELVTLCAMGAGVDRCSASPADVLIWSARDTSLASVGLTSHLTVNYSYPGSRGRVAGAMASPELFEVLGLEAGLGELFGREDREQGGTPGAVLSHGWWQQEWNGDPTVLFFNDTATTEIYTIVGVLSPETPVPEVNGLELAQIWTPLPVGAAMDQQRNYLAVGRLTAEGSASSTRQELAGLAWVHTVPKQAGPGLALSLFVISAALVSLGWVSLVGPPRLKPSPEVAGRSRSASRARSRSAA
jgi:hypothetical protein